MTKIYKSKIGFDVVAPFAVVLLTVEAFMLLSGIWTGALIIALVILFIVYLITDTSYKITSDAILKIRAGFLINREIHIQQIKKIQSTNTAIASPAFSFDRIKIIYNNYDSVIISPKDQNRFIEDLQMVNPKISVE